MQDALLEHPNTEPVFKDAVIIIGANLDSPISFFILPHSLESQSIRKSVIVCAPLAF